MRCWGRVLVNGGSAFWYFILAIFCAAMCLELLQNKAELDFNKEYNINSGYSCA